MKIKIPKYLTKLEARNYYQNYMASFYRGEERFYEIGSDIKGRFCESGAEAAALESALILERGREIREASKETRELFNLPKQSQSISFMK